MLESGASPHVVRDFLGHANISQTSTYLGTDLMMLEQAARRLDEHQKNCHTTAECDNAQPPTVEASDSAEVVKH